MTYTYRSMKCELRPAGRRHPHPADAKAGSTSCTSARTAPRSGASPRGGLRAARSRNLLAGLSTVPTAGTGARSRLAACAPRAAAARRVPQAGQAGVRGLLQTFGDPTCTRSSPRWLEAAARGQAALALRTVQDHRDVVKRRKGCTESCAPRSRARTTRRRRACATRLGTSTAVFDSRPADLAAGCGLPAADPGSWSGQPGAPRAQPRGLPYPGAARRREEEAKCREEILAGIPAGCPRPAISRSCPSTAAAPGAAHPASSAASSPRRSRCEKTARWC